MINTLKTLDHVSRRLNNVLRRMINTVKTLDHISRRLTNVLKRMINTLKTFETLTTVMMPIPDASSFEERPCQYIAEVFYIL